jgi:hypothetical protein
LNHTPFERPNGAGTTTGSGRLLNPKDKRGYRLPSRVRESPGVFD